MDPIQSKPKKAQLILAATHIGNIEDIPSRTLKAVKDCDILVVEEDKPARLVLKHAGIHRGYLKYTEHTETDVLAEVENGLRQKKSICYISDQGLPTLADPGAALLEIAYRNKSAVKIIPGPSSISSALAACPFLRGRYRYYGFLKRDKTERTSELKKLSTNEEPLVILDTPYRLKQTIEGCKDAFGKNRRCLLAMDISGAKENYILGTLDAVASKLPEEKLNFVLILDGNPDLSREEKKPGKKEKSGNRAKQTGKGRSPSRPQGQRSRPQKNQTNRRRR